MFELTPRPSTNHVPALDGVQMNVNFARAVLEHHVDGRLWVDRPSAPRAGHSLHPSGMSLVWGDGLGDVIEPLASHLREGAYRDRVEWLQVDPRWEHLDWDTLLQGGPSERSPGREAATVQRYSRVNFRFDRTTFEARHGTARVPVGYRLRPMSTQEFDLPGVGVVPSAYWRDATQFLAHGGGWCIEQDGVVAAISFTSFRFDDELEVGVETHPAHRGKGLALSAAVAMVRAALAAGLTPVWSCRHENEASLRLALRLGFEIARTGPYFRLPASNGVAA